jgi:murein DD-endopeptidase MepM/ murein hydrolase activator NlpD
LYEQNVTAKGDAVGDGQVIFAAVEAGTKTSRLYRYEFDKGQFDYFDEDGRTAKRGLLRTPVHAAQMTSGFGMRRHPILGYSKMHEGVDFAAPVGTPIFAAGDGVVVRANFFGAYGRYIQVRHNGRLQTAYAHLSRFADKLNAGDRVKQGQVIGYVGSSGRSTGPHLHYEVIIDGRKVNPMSVDVPTGRSLSKAEMVEFKRWRERLHADFQALNNGLPVGAVLAMDQAKRQ